MNRQNGSNWRRVTCAIVVTIVLLLVFTPTNADVYLCKCGGAGDGDGGSNLYNASLILATEEDNATVEFETDLENTTVTTDGNKLTIETASDTLKVREDLLDNVELLKNGDLVASLATADRWRYVSKYMSVVWQDGKEDTDGDNTIDGPVQWEAHYAEKIEDAAWEDVRMNITGEGRAFVNGDYHNTTWKNSSTIQNPALDQETDYWEFWDGIDYYKVNYTMKIDGKVEEYTDWFKIEKDAT